MKLFDNYRHILCGLTVVLQDDGDVHVDDDEEADHEVRQQEGDGHDGVPAVPLVARLGISWKQNILNHFLPIKQNIFPHFPQ